MELHALKHLFSIKLQLILLSSITQLALWEEATGQAVPLKCGLREMLLQVQR